MSKNWEEEQEWEVKGERRQKKLNKKRNIMRVNSRGLKTVILPLFEKEGTEHKKSDFSRTRVTNRMVKTYSFN